MSMNTCGQLRTQRNNLVALFYGIWYVGKEYVCPSVRSAVRPAWSSPVSLRSAPDRHTSRDYWLVLLHERSDVHHSTTGIPLVTLVSSLPFPHPASRRDGSNGWPRVASGNWTRPYMRAGSGDVTISILIQTNDRKFDVMLKAHWTLELTSPEFCPLKPVYSLIQS